MFDDKGQNQINKGQAPVSGQPGGANPPGNLPIREPDVAKEPEDILNGTDKAKLVTPASSAGPQRPSPFVPVEAPAFAKATVDRSVNRDNIPPDKGVAVPQVDMGTQGQGEIKSAPIPPEQMMAGVEGKKLSVGKKIVIIVVSVILVVALAGLGYWLYGRLTGEGELTGGLEEGIIGEDLGELEETGEEGGSAAGGYLEEELEPEPIPQVPIDTDGDGLTDEEENFLGTNINSADSDADGLPDRDEVEIYKTDPLNQDSDGDGYLDGEEVRGGYDPKGSGKLLELP